MWFLSFLPFFEKKVEIIKYGGYTSSIQFSKRESKTRKEKKSVRKEKLVMYNDILKIGPVTVHGYGLMIGIGVVAALLVGDYRAKKKGLVGDYLYGMTFVTVILGFMTAKILFILTEWQDFIRNPMNYIAGNGFVVYGGIIGGIVTILGYCKWKKIDFLNYIDLMVPCVALAQGFGRIGCFLAGCCYGKETDSVLGVTFTHSDFAPNNVKLFPSQLVMSAGDFVIAFLLLVYARKERTRGKITALYLILYSVGRFFVEFTRNDDRGFVGVLSTSQFIGIFTFLIGAVVFWGILPAREKGAMKSGNGKEK